MSAKKGSFIVFEGIDGSGKTTQINLLKQKIESSGTRCLETREPSDGPIGVMIRQCLTGRMVLDEAALAALFAADRLDHINNQINGIKTKIAEGISVISDRFVLSNYAYQSVNAPLEWVMQLNSQALNTLRPDCHIFIDVDPEITLKRMATGRFQTELFENKARLTQVRKNYLELIEKLKDTENIIVIDGNNTINDIAEEIWQNVSHLFSPIDT